jgi:hypothetical protein
MDRLLQKIGWKCPGAWKAALAGALLCLGLAGCAKFNSLRGDGFHDNGMGEEVRQAREPSAKPQEFWSFSNKARQIEADFPEK